MKPIPGRSGSCCLCCRHIRRNDNKCVILNSRITILQETYRRFPELEHFFSQIPVLDSAGLTGCEKARILKNHLEMNCRERKDILSYLAQDQRSLSHRPSPQLQSPADPAADPAAPPGASRRLLQPFSSFPGTPQGHMEK